MTPNQFIKSIMKICPVCDGSREYSHLLNNRKITEQCYRCRGKGEILNDDGIEFFKFLLDHIEVAVNVDIKNEDSSYGNEDIYSTAIAEVRTEVVL